MRFDVTTEASPGQVLQALTDFTERRPRIWHRTLDPKTYELRELGATWAVARESTAGSPFWVVERYDWSDPSVVRWADVETKLGRPRLGRSCASFPSTVAAAGSRPSGPAAAPRACATRCCSGCSTEGRCIASLRGCGERRWTSTPGLDAGGQAGSGKGASHGSGRHSSLR